ncbi:uncharacterized protein MYCFIDRAFT_177357 [Pseudocercospora fijiensis CIRAD86]|uniref:Uncharacterized protein n=1 Tax=Pseudocercospora fijiensis (strain CIRAD86) TaxID=383855 RepID=M3ASD2_PSEFD|nr:uncharacterized protein MYCFIDRAFT_177357 [Pseudocercospora fijiensis CIRAD86]EME80417.1 hypothetical protein MYCFIDRAFT_177357 [Pseudocercospora fijiensis CIRAD86]
MKLSAGKGWAVDGLAAQARASGTYIDTHLPFSICTRDAILHPATLGSPSLHASKLVFTAIALERIMVRGNRTLVVVSTSFAQLSSVSFFSYAPFQVSFPGTSLGVPLVQYRSAE